MPPDVGGDETFSPDMEGGMEESWEPPFPPPEVYEGGEPSDGGGFGFDFGGRSSGAAAVVIPNARLEVEAAKGYGGKCPVFFQLTDEATRGNKVEQFQGDAPLAWMAQSFVLVRQDRGQAVWSAPLKAPYDECLGNAKLALWDDSDVAKEKGHIAASFGSGRITLTVAPSRIDSEARMVAANVSANGMPRWRWEKGL